MHDVVHMHHFQPFKDAFHDHFNLLGSEFMLGFNFIVELSPFEQLRSHIDRVLRFVDFMKLHEVLMVEFPHDFDFVDKRFLPELFAIGSLLREGFDRIFQSVLMLDDEVDRGEVALSDLLDGFEKLVKSS